MSKRRPLRFTIDSLDEDGAGVGAPAALAGRRLHVPLALPGEEVVAEVTHESPHRAAAWGRLVEVARPSPERVEPACAAFGRCGGCALQHLAHPGQLAFKRGALAQALGAAGVTAPVGECVAGEPAPRPYRNRSKLVFARAGERIVLGAYAPRSHRVVDLAGCAVVIPPLDEVAGAIARLATALGVRPYDERTGEGDARYAILRAARDRSTQVMLVVARRGAPGLAALARALMAERPEVRGVVENLQPARGNALIGDVEPDLILGGTPELTERAGARLRVSPRSFFQAGWAGAEQLYRRAVEAAAIRDGDEVLDLYSGVGGIALLAAQEHPRARVVGVEEVPSAVEDAIAGLAQAGLCNARFERADAAAWVAARLAHGQRLDVALVDPPRRGLDEAVTRGLIALAPRRLVYVSCAPDTLARDLARFEAGGYRTLGVTPIDLLPDTPHVEAIAVLDRA